MNVLSEVFPHKSVPVTNPSVTPTGHSDSHCAPAPSSIGSTDEPGVVIVISKVISPGAVQLSIPIVGTFTAKNAEQSVSVDDSVTSGIVSKLGPSESPPVYVTLHVTELLQSSDIS